MVAASLGPAARPDRPRRRRRRRPRRRRAGRPRPARRSNGRRPAWPTGSAAAPRSPPTPSPGSSCRSPPTSGPSPAATVPSRRREPTSSCGCSSDDRRPVVADCGRIDGPAPMPAGGRRRGRPLAARPAPVLPRPRRALEAPLRPSGVVLLVEDGRAITAGDVEEALRVPVVARVRVTDTVARAVDAGLLVRPPPPLARPGPAPCRLRRRPRSS